MSPFNYRTQSSVNRLINITNKGDGSFIGGKNGTQYIVLGFANVLILVDENISEEIRKSSGNIWNRLDKIATD